MLKFLKISAYNNDMRYADIFSGIGGFRKGMDAAGHECVFSCEINKFARQTYEANYSIDHPFPEDITTVTEFPEFDVLCAGFPCQPFSFAGYRKGLTDERGQLFYELLRVLKTCKPKYFIFENVMGILSLNGGRTFKEIMSALTLEGYFVNYQTVNAVSWVPQRRKRIFIFGQLEYRLWNYPITVPKPALAIKHIIHPEDGTEDPEPPYTEGPMAKVAGKYYMTDRALRGALRRMFKEDRTYKGDMLVDIEKTIRTIDTNVGRKYKTMLPPNCKHDSFVDIDSYTRCMTHHYHKDKTDFMIPADLRPRGITPRECSRLMGFDGPKESAFVIPVSDTQAYKQFGNAVVPPLVTYIARRFLV